MKRLFFGFSIKAPWPSFYPEGRIIDEDMRHITCAFLGNVDFSPLQNALSQFPKPMFSIGPVGICDRLLFLPEKKPRVAAHHVTWLGSTKKHITLFHQKLLDWLESLNYSVDRRSFLPHTTIARSAFDPAEWEKAFQPLPVMITGIHLYESLGNLQYSSIWEMPLLPAFEEIEHTADIAFRIRGETPQALFLNGCIALSFQYPPFLSFLTDTPCHNIDQVVRHLNAIISQCDLQIGCPFKAVSYHGKVTKTADNTLQWEMIVDV